ncbi:hypothetical protein GCM10009760_49270 [Kitasatospora kazusensis]|uniref:Uncharacterized protein n=1 Tax=Kitasatospora kazusensis TaxID=407974 RepID=A0ABN3A2L5_9ACTN
MAAQTASDEGDRCEHVAGVVARGAGEVAASAEVTGEGHFLDSPGGWDGGWDGGRDGGRDGVWQKARGGGIRARAGGAGGELRT